MATAQQRSRSPLSYEEIHSTSISVAVDLDEDRVRQEIIVLVIIDDKNAQIARGS